MLPIQLFEPEARIEVRSILQRGVAANNGILRELAAREGVSFIEIDHLVDPEYLIDDCHFNDAGETELARTLAEHVLGSLPEHLLTGWSGSG